MIVTLNSVTFPKLLITMFKSQILLLTGLLICSTALCQLNKGAWMFVGSAGYNLGNYRSDATPNTKINSFQLYAMGGYFVAARLPIGIRATMQAQSQKSDYAYGTGRSRSSYRGIGPFVRYHFLKRTDRPLNIFVDAHYTFGSVLMDNYPGTYHFYRYTIAAGPVIYLNPKVGFDFTLGYFHEKISNGRNPASGLQAGLGFQFYFKKIRKSH